MSETTETRPRRTLADVVAHPPEGWVSNEKPHEGCVIFGWPSVERPAVVIFVDLEDGSMCGPPDWADDIEEYLYRDQAAAHRAVADLLDLLAEGSDG